MTPENLKKKQWLNRYRYLARRADDKRDDAEEWRVRLAKTVNVLSDMPRSPSPKNRPDDLWTVGIEFIDSLTETANTAFTDCQTIEQAIKDIPDVYAAEVLEHRYIHGLRWEQIAGKMYMSKSTVQRLHGKGLDLLIIPKC